MFGFLPASFGLLRHRRLTRVVSFSTGSSISHATAPDIRYGARDQDGFSAEEEMTPCIII